MKSHGNGYIRVGVKAPIHAEKVSFWGVGGTPWIHSVGRERDPPCLMRKG